MNYVVAAEQPQGALTDVYLGTYRKASEIIQRLIQAQIMHDCAIDYHSTNVASPDEMEEYQAYWAEQLKDKRQELLQYTHVIKQFRDDYTDMVNEAMQNHDPQTVGRQRDEAMRVITLLRERE